MDTVIVAFDSEEQCRAVRDLLEQNAIATCLLCRSGDQVRRALQKQQVYCVVCAYRLADGPAEWLCSDLPPACSMLMVGPRHLLDLCPGGDVVKLATPLNKDEVVTTVRLLLQFGHRMERHLRPRRPEEEKVVIARAKQQLMDRMGLTEEEAHRHLQKRSMDEGGRMIQTARRVLGERED